MGAAIAARLEAGDIVLLVGEMGSGKTTFVRGAARSLGAEGPVTSPTYALANRYEASHPVAHLDLHRLSGIAGEDEGLLDDHLTEDAIAFIEWPEAATGRLPRPPRMIVTFTDERPAARRITVEEPAR